jgi:hypothetical protein
MDIPLLSLRRHIAMTGNEYALESGAIVSRRFHKDRATVSHDIQWQGNSFTPTGDTSRELSKTFL